jgi:hypothetical protein
MYPETTTWRWKEEGRWEALDVEVILDSRLTIKM